MIREAGRRDGRSVRLSRTRSTGPLSTLRITEPGGGKWIFARAAREGSFRGLDHRDRFDLDHPVGMRQRRNLDQGRGGPHLAEELYADWVQLDPIPHVRHL